MWIICVNIRSFRRDIHLAGWIHQCNKMIWFYSEFLHSFLVPHLQKSAVMSCLQPRLAAGVVHQPLLLGRHPHQPLDLLLHRAHGVRRPHIRHVSNVHLLPVESNFILYL